MNDTDLKKKVASLGTIMGVWAHPDDESFMTGGLVSIAAANGQTVICVTATKGELGIQDESKWSAEKLADIRAAEIADAMKILGVKHHHFLGYTDGSCNQASASEAVGKITELIEKYKPDTLVSFPPDGGTGHPDHICASGWALEASKNTGAVLCYAVDLEDQYRKYARELDKKFNIYFNLDTPARASLEECDILLELTPGIAKQKCRALQAMPSQTGRMFEEVGFLKMCEAMSVEGYIKSDKNREWGRPKMRDSLKSA